MQPFWKHFCEDVGNNGRNGGIIFLITVALGLSLLVVCCILPGLLGDYFPLVVGVVVFGVVYKVCRAIRQARRNRGKYIIQPLAREEIRRARSKLLGGQKARKL
jgi:cobalamin biosynthesis protein CobD/CbiB